MLAWVLVLLLVSGSGDGVAEGCVGANVGVLVLVFVCFVVGPVTAEQVFAFSCVAASP